MNLSDNLKKIRKDNNLSQEDLAEKLGVSRQSVSKWESGVAYPEMDKVLELCKMFNLNIDELLNQDLKEVENVKQSKSSINKYIDSFLSYISKTVNLFSSMKFKSKIKCLFEQAFLAFIFFIIAYLLGEVLSSAVHSIFAFLPEKVFIIIYRLFEGIYMLFAFVVVISIMLYIFKIRYLDYFEIVTKKNEIKEEIKEEVKEEKDTNKKLERKEEKIIIRDPEHSGYKFINGLVKVILFFIKCFACFIAFGFSLSLIIFVTCIVFTFLISKSGLLFIGSFLGLVACVVINLIILDIIISFIVNRKVKKGLLIIAFLTSIIVGGISLGLVLISYKDFKIISGNNDKYYMTKEVNYKMTKDLMFISWGDIEYIENNDNDVKVTYEYANYCEINSFNDNGVVYFRHECMESPDSIKNMLRDLNDKVIVDDVVNIKIYTNKDNIKTIKNNETKYIKEGID